jgi:molybdate transport system substrate-binding protein
MRGTRRIGAWAAALILALTRAPAFPALAQAPAQGPVVAADSSLRGPLDAIAAAWAARNPTTPATMVYGPSGALEQRIVAGLAADVFIAADTESLDAATKAELLAAHTRAPILHGELSLIASSQTRSNLVILPGFDLAGALGDGKLALCPPETCPAGLYAKQALEALKIWPAIQGKIASVEDDAAVVAMVAQSGARFGIVFATDAKTDPNVRVIDTFPKATHEPIVFSAAVLARSKNPAAARFEAYLRSAEATRIFLAKGFAIPH